MDLSKRIQYDAEFPVEIVKPDEAQGGVTFWVKSMQSKVVQKVERDGRNKLIVSKKTRGDTGMVETDLDSIERVEREKVISAITRWEWGGNSFDAIGVDPEFNRANLEYVLDHENGGWIVDLLYAGAANIGNFTKS